MARKKSSAIFKAQVALKAVKNDLTIAKLTKKHEVHPTQIKDWKCELIGQAESIFSRKSSSSSENSEKYVSALRDFSPLQCTS